VYKEVYEKLNTKEVKKDIYRITRIIERKTRDEEIKKRWREYFDKLFKMVVLLKTWMTLPFSARI